MNDSSYQYGMRHGYIQNTDLYTRRRFSKITREAGLYPIVIDSFDKILSAELGDRTRYNYGLPLKLNGDVTLGMLMASLRKKLVLNSYEGYLLYSINGAFFPNSSRIFEIYNRHKKSDDNILYLYIQKESIFGH